MPPSSSPGQRLKQRSADVVGQLQQANRAWSEAYQGLKDKKHRVDKQLKDQNEELSVLKEQLRLKDEELKARDDRPTPPAITAEDDPYVKALLTALAFPTVQAALAHLSSSPLPLHGGLPALHEQLLNTQAHARLMSALQVEMSEWWQDKDRVTREMEDERDRRVELEAEVEALKAGKSRRDASQKRSSTPTKAGSPRSRPLTPSRRANVTNPILSPSTDAAVLAAQVQALKKRLAAHKEHHHMAKRHWRVFGDRLATLSKDGRLDLTGGSTAVADGRKDTAALAGFLMSGNTSVLSGMTVHGGPGLGGRGSSATPRATTGGTSPPRATRPVFQSSPLRKPSVDIEQPDTATAAEDAPKAPARHPLATAHAADPTPPTASADARPSLTLPKRPKPSLASSPTAAAHSVNKSSPLSPLSESPVSSSPRVNDVHSDSSDVGTSVPFERKDRVLLSMRRPGDEKIAEEVEEGAQMAENGGPAAVDDLDQLPPAPQLDVETDYAARTSVAPRPSRLGSPAEEDVFRAPPSSGTARPPAIDNLPSPPGPAPPKKRARLVENLERMPGLPTAASATPAPALPSMRREAHQTPIPPFAGAAGRKNASAYYPTPETGARPSYTTASSSRSTTPVSAAPHKAKKVWLGKRMFANAAAAAGATPEGSGNGARKRKLALVGDVDIDMPMREGAVTPLQYAMQRPTLAVGGPAGEGKREWRAEAPVVISSSSPAPDLAAPVDVKLEPADIEAFHIGLPNAEMVIPVAGSPPHGGAPRPWERTVSQEEAEEARFRALKDPEAGMNDEERKAWRSKLKGMPASEVAKIYAPFKGRGRYAVDNAAEKAINEEFELVPERNQGLNYAFDDVVRNREDRRQLHAADCACCKGYYETVGNLPPVYSGPIWRLPQPSPPREGETAEQRAVRKRREEVDAHRQEASRHREHHPIPATPPEYWETGMYNDDQVDRINREARRIQEEKRRRIEAEAAKKDGLYRRR